MNLFKTELRRILRRRLTLIFGILSVAGLLTLVGVMGAISSKGPSEAELAEAQIWADEANETNPEFNDCVRNEDHFETEDYVWIREDPVYEELTHQERCEYFVGGYTAEDYLYVYTFNFANEGQYTLVGVVIVVGLIMMMVASSAIGAEWSSGGMSNLMVWHPNRLKVWGVKLVAALAICTAAVVAFSLLAFGLLYLVAVLRGEVGDMNSAWWETSMERWSRTGLLALGMTMLGASLAMLGRHTAIASGVIAGYLIIGDLIVSLVSMALPMDYPERLSLYTWVGAWISGRIELYNWNAEEFVPDVMVITSTDAGLLLGGVVLFFALLATWSFRRRDAA